MTSSEGKKRRLPEGKKGNSGRRLKKKAVEVPKRELPEPIALALLSMFAMVDDVFTEDDAFDELKKKIGYGRIYEEWKRCRVVLDPEFNPEVQERPARWLPKMVRQARGTSRPATGSQRSSSGTTSISGKNRAAKNVKPSRSTSAKRRAN